MSSDNIRRDDWETLTPTVCGWGINDVNYKIRPVSTRVLCPYYQDWASIIERCHNSKYQDRQPSYKGCIIVEEWKYLSNFIKWVDSQPNRDWKNCVPDKDLLSAELKYYGPSTVAYLSQRLNNFLISEKKRKVCILIGVALRPDLKTKPFRAFCRNPYSQRKTKATDLGYFRTELEAHKAWQAKKHEYACMLAGDQIDTRVADALRQRYSPDKDWTKI